MEVGLVNNIEHFHGRVYFDSFESQDPICVEVLLPIFIDVRLVNFCENTLSSGLQPFRQSLVPFAKRRILLQGPCQVPSCPSAC